MTVLLALAAAIAAAAMPAAQEQRTPPGTLLRIPDKLVLLTFDDAKAGHYTVVRPLLKKYGFGATFFITEGFTFRTNKDDYLTWDQIAELHRDGFEIGNHTRKGTKNTCFLCELCGANVSFAGVVVRNS